VRKLFGRKARRQMRQRLENVVAQSKRDAAVVLERIAIRRILAKVEKDKARQMSKVAA
jgi:hypothetical protein